MVYCGSWRDSPVAVKVLRHTGLTLAASQASLVSELRVLARLRHRRVVRMLCACVDLASAEGSAAIVMELMERGSLYSMLHDDTRPHCPSTDAQRLQCSIEIADGMYYLHSSRLIHRDLKSHNVLVNSRGGCKISDFGMATYRGEGASRVSVRAGTAAWSSPESFDPDCVLRESTVGSVQ